MSLITVDPGLTGTGVASWEYGELTSAGIIAADPKESLVYRISEISALVYQFAKISRYVVIERPQTYGGRAAKGDANDLLVLAMLVGGIITECEPYMEIELITPRDWKGSTPKAVTARQVAMKLSGVEKARVETVGSRKQMADVVDAIGIGLWKLGR